MNNPVGVGPYVIKQWIKGNKLHLVKNPNYSASTRSPRAKRRRTKPSSPKYQGRDMPLVGNVEISIIEEANPRLLTFKEGRTDHEFVGNDLIGNVVQNGKLAPDPPPKASAISARLNPRWLTTTSIWRTHRRRYDAGPDRPATRHHHVVPDGGLCARGVPQSGGAGQPDHPANADRFLPNKPNLNKQDVQLANALLGPFGYKDVDGDGFREMPDGKPLVITRSSTPARDRPRDR